jgi:hypothetical protein
MIAMAMIVLVWTAIFGLLNFAAVRRWRDSWELVRWIPTFVLALWDFYLILDSSGNSTSHNLWPIELFGMTVLSLILLAFLAIAYDARTRWLARQK